MPLSIHDMLRHDSCRLVQSIQHITKLHPFPIRTASCKQALLSILSSKVPGVEEQRAVAHLGKYHFRANPCDDDLLLLHGPSPKGMTHVRPAQRHAAKADVHRGRPSFQKSNQVLWRRVVHALGSLQLAEAHHLSALWPVGRLRQQRRAPAVGHRHRAVVLQLRPHSDKSGTTSSEFSC